MATAGQATRAGEMLLLSQAAVSMAVAELENLTGGPLFERLGRRLLLNERGRLLLPEAQEILRRAGAIEKALKESAEEPAGVLNIGASTTIGNYLLPSILGEFVRMYPLARTMLHVGNTRQVEAAVESAELDIGLIEGSSRSQKIDRVLWKKDELFVIAGPRHPWAKERRVTAGMLARAEWIMREKGSGTREVFEKAMARKTGGFNVVLELGHTEAIKKAVEAGLGVSCLSRLAVQREIDNNWLVAVDTPLDLRRTLMLLCRKNDYRTKLFKTFLGLLMSLKNFSCP